MVGVASSIFLNKATLKQKKEGGVLGLNVAAVRFTGEGCISHELPLSTLQEMRGTSLSKCIAPGWREGSILMPDTTWGKSVALTVTRIQSVRVQPQEPTGAWIWVLPDPRC